MLPILPALLLLLLGGASKMDRAVAACLPGGSEAMHRASKQVGDATKAERLWASLLALKVGPEEMDRAFAVLLAIDASETPLSVESDSDLESSVLPHRDPSRPLGADGWTRSCRTRDGPISR